MSNTITITFDTEKDKVEGLSAPGANVQLENFWTIGTDLREKAADVSLTSNYIVGKFGTLRVAIDGALTYTKLPDWKKRFIDAADTTETFEIVEIKDSVRQDVVLVDVQLVLDPDPDPDTDTDTDSGTDSGTDGSGDTDGSDDTDPGVTDPGDTDSGTDGSGDTDPGVTDPADEII